MTIDWSSGVSSAIHCYRVDPRTWGDYEEVGIEGGTVDRIPDGLRETADLDVSEMLGECIVRVYADARQGGSYERVAVFTGLATTPERGLDGGHEKYRAECSSVLKIADDVLLPRGWYAPAGYPAAKLAARLLGVFGVRCSYADGSPDLTGAIVAEDGESNLSMAWRIAQSIGWAISVDGMGSVSVAPKGTEPSIRLDAVSYDVIEPKITDSADRFGAPNVLRVTMGDATAEARDDDPDSSLSTVSRRREVWAVEDDPELNGTESLAGYAQRKLRELQGASRKLKYSRRFDPDTRPGDMARIAYPGASIDGTFRIDAQRIDIGALCRIEEEATEC